MTRRPSLYPSLYRDIGASMAGIATCTALAGWLAEPASTLFVALGGVLAGRMIMLPWKHECRQREALDRVTWR